MILPVRLKPLILILFRMILAQTVEGPLIGGRRLGRIRARSLTLLMEVFHGVISCGVEQAGTVKRQVLNSLLGVIRDCEGFKPGMALNRNRGD